MIIPNEVLKKFEQEADSFSFGKASLSVVKRGAHCHYEVDRHITIPASENSGEILPTGEEKG